VFAVPMSVLSVLIATSKLYNTVHVMSLLLVLLVLNGGLVALGFYLIVHALRRLRRLDGLLREIKRKHSAVAQFLD
jgi:hypothetical protein